MSGRTPPSIWALVEEAAATLPEPFSRPALISWIEKRRPDVETSSISTHIHYAIADVPNRDRNPLGRREPILERIDRGLYRRYRGPDRPARTAGDDPAGTAAETASPPVPATAPGATALPAAHVVLVGCSSRKAPRPLPARELFQGSGFQRARDRAMQLKVPWFVLSAKYGLLDPDDVVGPYDVYLGGQASSYGAAWGEWVAEQLAARLPLRGATVEVHAGDAYCSPLRRPLQRLGASLSEPLAGLTQGKRLAWPGYQDIPFHRPATTPAAAPSLQPLLDPAAAGTPTEFLAAGAEGRQVPGLYTWWVDEDGARALSAGVGQPVQAGLLYAGKAGGHRPSAAPSSSTLWGRVAGNHLRGNISSSTFRRSLAALLTPAGKPVSEEALTGWMHGHLRVAVLPVPSEFVAGLEDELVARADPPLNLAGTPRHPTRSALTRLRGLMSRGPAESKGPSASVPPAAMDRAHIRDATRAFDRRVREDLRAMIATGYRPSIFQRMLAESGAVGTARRLLAASALSDGFRYLWEHGLLRHSIENAVLDDQFDELFTAQEKAVARQRLADAGYL